MHCEVPIEAWTGAYVVGAIEHRNTHRLSRRDGHPR